MDVELGSQDLPGECDSFAESLQRLLESRFPHGGLPSLEEAGEITGASQRTVKRRLFEEGITYRELLDRIRFRAARKMLGNTNLSVRDIALELGYSGPNNFIRAFKRIAGVTPSEYRQDSR